MPNTSEQQDVVSDEWMRPFRDADEGLWVIGPTTDQGATPRKLFEGTYRDALQHCSDVDEPYWVIGKVERVNDNAT